MSLSRRMFLRGAGAAVALPVLPSLLSAREARAQAMTPERYMIMYATHHGGVWRPNMFPALPTSGVDTLRYANRNVRRAPLSLTVSGGNASLSPVLTAPSSRFTSGLAAKLNLLDGLDVPFYLGHHTGGYLGNFARNDGNGEDGRVAQQQAARRTIDQLMAWSPTFYPTLDGIRERAVVLGPGISYNFSNPSDPTTPLQEIGSTSPRPNALYDRLFPRSGTMRGPIIDRVLESYTLLRASPRLSTADKRRLDDHLQRLAELERKLSVGAMCVPGTRPSGVHAGRTREDLVYSPQAALDPVAHAGHYKLMNDIVVAAMACGLTRIASINVAPTFSTYSGDWHQEVAHQTAQIDGVRQATMVESKQRFFSEVFLDLAEKLEAVDMGDGTRLLDHALAWWTQESGSSTHSPVGMPVVAFGSAGGTLRTGSHVDYRNTSAIFSAQAPAAQRQSPGLMWHQWLGTVLEAMGIPRAEFENAAVNRGYPDFKYAVVRFSDIDARVAYPEATWSVAGEILPFLRP